MRLPRPRFTIQLLMIVVTITALLLGSGIGSVGLVRRARQFREMASYHANLEQCFLSLQRSHERLVEASKKAAEASARIARTLRNDHPQSREDPLVEMTTRMSEEQRDRCEREIKSFTRWIAYYSALTSYHARLKQMYKRAASYPWETVLPDFPQPNIDFVLPDSPARLAKPNPHPPRPQRRSVTEPILTAVPSFPEPEFSAA